MRRVITLAGGTMLMALAACSAEPDFDQRFDQKARELNTRAKAIETEAGAQLAAAREAEAAQAEAERGAAESAGRK